jgi:hypothetical protein
MMLIMTNLGGAKIKFRKGANYSCRNQGVWGREQHLLPHSNPVERLCVFPPKMEFGSGRAKKFAFITP